MQEIDFLSNNDYYITSLDCKLKVKNHIHDDKKKKIEELSEKSRLLLEKGAAYQNDINYLLLKTLWYVKNMNYTYRFKLFPEIINQYNYKYKFFNTVEKKIRDCQIYSPHSQFIGKGFNLEREVVKSKALVVQLSEDNKNVESFFLHQNPNHPTQFINFLFGRNYYRDINLYYTYDTQHHKQWFTTKTDFFYRAMAEIINLPSWNIFHFMKRYYFQEKRGNVYLIGTREQRQQLGNRAYLMPLIWENDNI